jgi:hypothetical protein
VTNGALILLLLLSEWDCGVGAQEKCIGIQAGLLYFSFFPFWLLGVGCHVLVLLVCCICCWLLFFCWLSGVAVGCQMLNMDCRNLLSVVVVDFELFGVSCWLSIVCVGCCSVFFCRCPALHL